MNLPVLRAFYEGKKKFIDTSVFDEETYKEDYDGTGIEEVELGAIIRFTMELLGQISQAIKGKSNPIYFKKSLFNKLKTNDDIYKTLNKWTEECNILIV